MIKSLHLSNFKGFEEHTIEFRSFSVVVGKNNAGKSSAIEALRIIATVAKKFATHKYHPSPSWTNDIGTGISPLLDEVNLKLETIFFKYSAPPAKIRAVFKNDSEVIVYFGPGEEIHARALTPSGEEVGSRKQYRECKFTPIFILPQISPLQDSERVLRKHYVKKCIDTQLSSRHFRNQIRFMYEHFDVFCELFNSTWEIVRIIEFDDPKAEYEDNLFLMLREEGFVAEVSSFGHGLQMWLQIVWFVARIDSHSIVILDEPDVYMHPQQQGRMIELLRSRFKQCILTTHAPGILEHCNESEILRLHRKLEKSSCEVDAETYEERLKTAILRPNSTTQFSEDEDLVEVKAIVYQGGSLAVTDSTGKQLIDIRTTQNPEKAVQNQNESKDFGIKQAIMVKPFQILSIEIDQPDDVDVFFNGSPLAMDSSKDKSRFAIQTFAKSVIDADD